MTKPGKGDESERMKRFVKGIGILFFWCALWELSAILVDNSFILVGPVDSLRHLILLMTEADFLKTVLFTTARILSAYISALFLAFLFSLLSYDHPFLAEFLKPPLFLLRSLPVASFVIILLFFIGRESLSFFIAFWMAFPIFYFNLLEGLFGVDRKLLEMSEVFHFSFWKKLRYLFLPGIYSELLSAAKLAMGLCWKSGIAAELIGQVKGSIGYKLMDAKVSLSMGDVFAWSLVMIFLSKIFECLVLFLLERGIGRECRT